MTSAQYRQRQVESLLETAKAILDGRVGIILGSRRLQRYRFELGNDLDEDFLPLVGVDSETDHLPVDEERRNWSPEALLVKDQEIAEAEAYFKDIVIKSSCQLIVRFEKELDRRN